MKLILIIFIIIFTYIAIYALCRGASDRDRAEEEQQEFYRRK